MNAIDSALKSLLPPKQFGGYLFRRYPLLARAWGGPMNGQGGRCKLVADLINRCAFTAIVETGTYRGTTTEWLSAFQMPIYTCESSDENFGFASARLAALPNVHLIRSDSRTALRQTLSGPLGDAAHKAILFYLDAHWNDDLPLAEELDIIFATHHEALVLIDDFQVPDDAAYSFDDYGQGKALTLDYVAMVATKYDLVCRFPTLRASEETGARRGCVAISKRSASVTKAAAESHFLRLLSTSLVY